MLDKDRIDIVLLSGRFDHVKVGAARRLIASETDLTTPPITRRFYGGCKDHAGHYLWDHSGKKRWREPVIPWDSWDGPLQPGNHVPDGVALLSYKREDGGPIWTAIGFNDRTVDSRPGSHSTFIVDSHLSFDAALADAREHWPQIFERFNFEIVEQV